MNIEEFRSRAKRAITDNEYEIIELVYTWHPSIVGNNAKDKIAKLYSDYGMNLIRDMIPTARRCQTVMESIQLLKFRIEEYEQIYQSIKNSEELNCEQIAWLTDNLLAIHPAAQAKP